MLFKDFLNLFNLNETNISICDVTIEEYSFYCSKDDDVDILELYIHFDVIDSYVSMHSYRYGVFIPCLVVILDFFGDD